jgi:hypothetical protein
MRGPKVQRQRIRKLECISPFIVRGNLGRSQQYLITSVYRIGGLTNKIQIRHDLGGNICCRSSFSSRIHRLRGQARFAIVIFPQDGSIRDYRPD